MITQLMPAMVEVADKEVHSPEFATLYVNQAIDFKPGQFVMVWIPGVDEKPYTISHHTSDRFAITIEAKGRFSKKAVSLVKNTLKITKNLKTLLRKHLKVKVTLVLLL